MKTTFLRISALVLTMGMQTFSDIELPQYDKPEGMIRGGEFDDLFLPVPIIDGLENGLWGVDSVNPRDADNGLEDATYSYWGGNIVKGDDGKYHAFICRWREDNVVGKKSGHHTWWSSIVTHSVSDDPLGPYKVLEEIGPGHNPEIYRKKDGSYIIGIMGEFHYHAESINGPWEKRETRMEKLMDYINVTNRTYILREDGSIYMMNKSALVYISENADEHFDQITTEYPVNRYPGSHQEDPVVWKDEVQYHCIYNDAFNRVGSYMRSPDGIEWKWTEGVAYDPTIMKHDDGTVEGWYKMERPKVLLDEYGRVTHMNFAVMDSKKDDDVANDNHSSKNVVVPLTLSRRLEILNPEVIEDSTTEIRVKIRADDDFDPQTEIDLESLVFGAPEGVNVGQGCKAIKVEADGCDAILTFSGEGNGLTEDNFAAKLLGQTNTGGLIYGYAKVKRIHDVTGNISASKMPSAIPNDGPVPVQIDFETSKLCKLSVRLVDKETQAVVGSKNHYVYKEGTATIYVPIRDIEPSQEKYQWEAFLYPDNLNGHVTHIDSFTEGVSVYKDDEHILTKGTWSVNEVTCSHEHWKYKASNVFDGNPFTYWEPGKTRDEWIQVSLNEEIRVTGVEIKFVRGDLRRFEIEILGSNDGRNWETYYAGTSDLSYDLTSMFVFGEMKECSYFKLITKGSDVNEMNGVFEIIPILDVKTNQL